MSLELLELLLIHPIFFFYFLEVFKLIIVSLFSLFGKRQKLGAIKIFQKKKITQRGQSLV